MLHRKSFAVNTLARLHRFWFAILVLTLTACSESDSAGSPHHSPQSFTKSDECHVCGMMVSRFSGPKGQAFEGQMPTSRKFCSTRDLLSWYFQPEIKPNVAQLFVHDMSRSDWNQPDDRHLIDAKLANYVIGSTKNGAMGPTLASFSERTDAETFSKQFGGSVFEFNELSLEVINSTHQAK